MSKINLLLTIFALFILSSCEKDVPEPETQPIEEIEETEDKIDLYDVQQLVEENGLRNGPEYSGATIFYPSNATPPYASIVIVTGYQAYQSHIKKWGPYLAARGIVTMTIGTNGLEDWTDKRALALLDAVETLRFENTRTGSPLFGKIDLARFAVGGWSMGGGGAELAAVKDTTLKAVLALCPWLDTSISQAGLDTPVPLLIISGELDTGARPNIHANVQYNKTRESTDKLLFEVANGDHGVANDPNGRQGQIGQVALNWLKVYLEEDATYRPSIFGKPSSASKYITNLKP